jgi:hypothetical protein
MTTYSIEKYTHCQLNTYIHLFQLSSLPLTKVLKDGDAGKYDNDTTNDVGDDDDNKQLCHGE